MRTDGRTDGQVTYLSAMCIALVDFFTGEVIRVQTIGVFEQANVALIRWIKEGSNFILIWMAHTLVQ